MIGNLIETIQGADYSRVDSRFINHEGCIVDIGCLAWDWSSYFIGKKRIIGVDPLEIKKFNNVELFNGLIGSFNGRAYMKSNGISSSVFLNNDGGEEYPVLSWKSFCEKFNIDKISILKINIEGSEYSLINSFDRKDFSRIDQIAISFHDWINPDWSELTKTSLLLLENSGFNVLQINKQWNWYLAVKK